MLKQAKKVKIK